MIIEIAEIEIAPNKTNEFEKAFVTAKNKYLLFAKGYIKHKLIKSIENPSCYKLLISWQTLESHTIDFRESNDFVKWREILGPFFVTSPTVFHYETI